MNKKPKILISSTTDYLNYTSIVESCGGTAISICYPEVSVDYDGLIFLRRK